MMSIVGFSLLLLGLASALTMNVVGGKQQCIWEEGGIGDQLFASFEVTKGSYSNLVVSVVQYGDA